MIAELREVIDKVAQLTEEEQRIIAKMLDAEMQWDRTLNNTQDALTKLADEALRDYQSGNIKSTDW